MPVAQDKYAQVQYQSLAFPVLPIPPTIQLGRDPVFPDTTRRLVQQNFAAMQATGMVTPVNPIPPSIVLGWSAVYPDATRRAIGLSPAIQAGSYFAPVAPIAGPSPGSSTKEQIVYAGTVQPMEGASGSVVQT